MEKEQPSPGDASEEAIHPCEGSCRKECSDRSRAGTCHTRHRKEMPEGACSPWCKSRCPWILYPRRSPRGDATCRHISDTVGVAHRSCSAM